MEAPVDPKGIIFDIKEFSVNDGPGVRQTVFFKGCPLHCAWCHNPEGMEHGPQLMIRYGECVSCGKCADVCESRAEQECIACGKCATTCPLRLRSVCGREITSSELAATLLKDKDIYADMGGGVTFSGGEPLMQPMFLSDVIKRLPGVHTAVETCGYAERDVFENVMNAAGLMMLDIKLIDPALHKHWCGVDNTLIIENLSLLKSGDVPFIIRVPLIPGVTDGDDNLHRIARLLKDARTLMYVELLPYNRLAGAKYGQLGSVYEPGFDTEKPLSTAAGIFEQYGSESRIL